MAQVCVCERVCERGVVFLVLFLLLFVSVFVASFTRMKKLKIESNGLFGVPLLIFECPFPIVRGNVTLMCIKSNIR